MSNSSGFVRSSNFIFVLLILSLFPFFSVVFSDELVSVASETVSLQVTPRIEVTDSSCRNSICERLHINGLQRLKHIDKYAHSLKLVLSSNTSNILRTSIDVCFHRNSSLAIGMCPHGQWKKVSKGSWVGIMSPFDYKILDIRTSGGSSEFTLEFSAKQEFFMYRMVFLIMGIVLLSSASTLSMSLPFYYICAMSIGIIILATLIINQGMKRLPTRGKSRLELFLYSSMIGVGGYFLEYFCGFIQHLLITQIRISEDLYIPMAILAGAFVFLFGAWSGFWTVKKFVLTKDGSIDITTSIFVSWTIRAFAVILILQSSVDPLLAGGALISGTLISSILKSIIRKLLSQRIVEQDVETENCIRGLIHVTTFASPLPKGMNKMPRKTSLSDSDTFPSSFHKTQEGRRKFTKEELAKFTRESTEKAVKELVSSPGFGEWAVKNAKRISVNPIEDSSTSKFIDTVKRRRWFFWF
ncbi:hypothetical protein EUTSA_v10010344mg [Eutrema salsugineum]|uniref:Uncharacterized protein n=1 Tax=Eutrema salsugineum TaxID=72664 RepID=V4NHA9_EUTSA|nr:uncharacterized protein LOC18021296 [Eutrema salsugineum]ESQ45551.1 hypothetical protein EUTSA_v10010344mg [Eutrema salsugineum]